MVHAFLAGLLERFPRHVVAGNQVDPAFQPLEQSGCGQGMGGAVVEVFDEDILERKPALVMPRITVQVFYGVHDREGFFRRHQSSPFLVERRMQADGKVAGAFGKETFQGRQDSHAGKGYPVRAPGEAPIRVHHLQGFEHMVRVVQGFAHAHQDHVAQLPGLGNAVKLVQDFMGLQMVVEALAARGAESAVHPAARLGRNAKGCPFVFRNEDGFYAGLFPVFSAWRKRRLEKVFPCPVLGSPGKQGNVASDFGPFCQYLAVFEGNIAHLFPGPDSFLINPSGNLPGGEFGETEFLTEGFQFGKCFP